MFNVSSVQLDWQGLNLKLETGMIARQSDGAVLATLGNTSVLCTVNASRESDPNLDFFPLSVHYIEKAYAAGKIALISTPRRSKDPSKRKNSA